ncbi:MULTISPECIES: hypothetical protein [unclassified Moraxella]|uniref:hypothetical protein n=1 Tax=unclassified Moraxella TaxID=2685852 RepID=UPI002B40622F|nr:MULTISPECIES: hypothetical protein [unclassified Moraxella]
MSNISRAQILELAKQTMMGVYHQAPKQLQQKYRHLPKQIKQTQTTTEVSMAVKPLWEELKQLKEQKASKI